MAARKRSGFTLIELLVVIAIIAILAAILFPVFARAREAARKSNCQSNMKECAIALQTYWNDYDATLPSSKWAQSAPDSAWDAGEFQLFTFYAGAPPVGNIVPRSWFQKLYNSMKSKDIVFCPSDSEDHANMPTAKLSYWWKLAIDQAWSGTGTSKCQKEGQFGYNADQIVFYERAGFHEGNGTGYYNTVKINVAFLDTHVRNVSVVNSPARTRDTQINTSATGGLQAQGEPNYFNYDNEPASGTGDMSSIATAVATYVDPTRFSDKLP